MNELQPFGMGVGKVDIENVMLEGDMIDQRTSHIEGCQMDDLILPTDGLHNLPRRSWKVLHKQNTLTPFRAAQYGSPCDSPGQPCPINLCTPQPRKTRLPRRSRPGPTLGLRLRRRHETVDDIYPHTLPR